MFNLMLQVMIVLDLLEYPGVKRASDVDDKAGSFSLIQKHNIWLVVVHTLVSLEFEIP